MRKFLLTKILPFFVTLVLGMIVTDWLSDSDRGAEQKNKSTSNVRTNVRYCDEHKREDDCAHDPLEIELKRKLAELERRIAAIEEAGKSKAETPGKK